MPRPRYLRLLNAHRKSASTLESLFQFYDLMRLTSVKKADSDSHKYVATVLAKHYMPVKDNCCLRQDRM